MKWIVAILALTTLAGCISDDGDAPDTTPDPTDARPAATRYALPEDPMPEGPGHDHADPGQHKFLWNYDLSAHDPLLMNEANMAGLHAITIEQDYLFGAVYGSHTASVDGGMVVWDISDPTKPVQTGRWTVPGSVGGDRSIGATQDVDYVVLSTEAVTCFSQAGANPFTVYLIDVRDKSLPVVADVITVAGPSLGSPDHVGAGAGVHSVWVHRIQGEDYAFLWGDIYHIDRTEQGGRLVQTGKSVSVGHDMYVRDTPWNTTWGLAAGPNFRLYDLSDPLAPVLLAEWALPEDYWFSDFDYYMHTADVWFGEDQDVIIVTTEDWLDWTSQMFILDATPLRDFQHAGEPMLLSHTGMWANPGNHTAAGLSFSLHNPRFHDDGLLTVSSYHGGLWQLDFRHPDFRMAPDAKPAEVAYAVWAAERVPLVMDPVQGADICGLGYGVDAPTYMDVAVGPGGILYAADVYTGLYTFNPTTDHPVYGA